MKNTILKNGLWATVVIVIPTFIAWLVIDGVTPEAYFINEVIGYSSILLAMIFVFLGVKKCRDEHLDGHISFGQALKIGVFITIIPSLAFGAYNILYTEVLDPQMVENYFNVMLEKERAVLSATEFAAKKTEMEAQAEMFNNPFIQFFVMFMTVFIIGFIVTLISALFLKKEKTVIGA